MMKGKENFKTVQTLNTEKWITLCIVCTDKQKKSGGNLTEFQFFSFSEQLSAFEKRYSNGEEISAHPHATIVTNKYKMADLETPSSAEQQSA